MVSGNFDLMRTCIVHGVPLDFSTGVAHCSFCQKIARDAVDQGTT